MIVVRGSPRYPIPVVPTQQNPIRIKRTPQLSATVSPTPGDLRAATPTIGAAVGAATVQVLHRSSRHDRAVLVIYRPRWGRLGR
jgi:hypothetical protein